MLGSGWRQPEGEFSYRLIISVHDVTRQRKSRMQAYRDELTRRSSEGGFIGNVLAMSDQYQVFLLAAMENCTDVAVESCTDMAMENCTLLVPEEAFKWEPQGGSREVRRGRGILLHSVSTERRRRYVWERQEGAAATLSEIRNEPGRHRAAVGSQSADSLRLCQDGPVEPGRVGGGGTVRTEAAGSVEAGSAQGDHRDPSGAPTSIGHRRPPIALGAAVRPDCGLGIFPVAVVPVLRAQDDAGGDAGSGGLVHVLRGCAWGTSVRPDEGGHRPGGARRGDGRSRTGSSFASAATGDYGWGLAGLIELRRRGRYRGRPTTSGRVSSMVGTSCRTSISTLGLGSGGNKRRTSGTTGRLRNGPWTGSSESVSL